MLCQVSLTPGTAKFSRTPFLLFKEKHSAQVWLSLMPIVVGVAIATLTELRFQWDGMLAALLATACFSLQNIYSKIVLRETRMHHLRLLYLISKYTFICLIPSWLFYDVPGYFKDASLEFTRQNSFTAFILLSLSGLIMLSQSVVAFSVIHFLSPLSYSVANAGKRIVVILFSLMTLRNPVTLMNVFGIGRDFFSNFLRFYDLKMSQKISKNLKKKNPSFPCRFPWPASTFTIAPNCYKMGSPKRTSNMVFPPAIKT